VRVGRFHLHHGAARPAAGRLPVIALVGRPNVGKSTLMSAASGRYVESVNAPGTTVAVERVRVTTPEGSAWLADTPGTLSLQDSPAGGEPFWKTLTALRPDAILFVGDAGDLRRHLPLALACRDLGLPLVFAANLVDEAASHGVEIDAGRLSQLLAAPVHLTNGRRGSGVAHAVEDAVRMANYRRERLTGAAPRSTVPARIYDLNLERHLTERAREIRTGRSLGAALAVPPMLRGLVLESAISARGAAALAMGADLEPARWRVGADWAGQVERRRDVATPLADRLSIWTTSIWPGLPLFIGVTLAVFVTMLIVGGVLSDVLTRAWDATVAPGLTGAAQGFAPGSPIAAGVLWGLNGGILALLAVGIPYIFTFYLLLAVLEDSGYLTSAAVLTDRLFHALGLPGRAAIPLLTATGCNVPAIYGTRVLPRRRERLIGAFLVTMVPCSAGSAVVMAALAPFAGPAVALAAFVVIGAITFGAGLAANAIVPGRQSELVLELAPLRRPVLRHVARKAWFRFAEFARTAAPIMLGGSIVLGLAYETGTIWPAAKLLDPVVIGWLGLPSVAGLAMVFGFLRKELALQLLVALAVVQLGATAATLSSFMTPGQLFVFAIVTSVSMPCAATLAALIGEFGWRPALAMLATTLTIALAAGGLLARLLGVA
jgi:ferrous iron transport protein B